MIGLSAIAERIKLPAPVFLIMAGIGVGFIPGLPPIALNPEIVFLIFLPPLLYDAAFNTSFQSFKTHINYRSGFVVTLADKISWSRRERANCLIISAMLPSPMVGVSTDHSLISMIVIGK